MARKTYNEKLMDSRDMPKIVEVSDSKTIARYGGNKMLIAPPLMYDAVMKQIPNGRLITAELIRNHLAKSLGADYTCPLTAGIFINIVANACEERGTDITPYWRTLKTGGVLNNKYPGGVEHQKNLLSMEGHTILHKGKNYVVKDFEKKLFELES